MSQNARAAIKSARHTVRIHPSSYTVGAGGSYAGDKATWAWSWPPTSI